MEAVISAFALYFQLVNLAEARGRVRALRRRERAARDGVLDDSIGEAIGRLRALGRTDADLDAQVGALAVTPVLTAHPTEARRRTILVALRRCGDLLARMDDPRLTPSEDADVRRRLREEITLLWRTADLRPDRAGARSTRSGPRWRSSTRRCSRSLHAWPACWTGRSMPRRVAVADGAA